MLESQPNPNPEADRRYTGLERVGIAPAKLILKRLPTGFQSGHQLLELWLFSNRVEMRVPAERRKVRHPGARRARQLENGPIDFADRRQRGGNHVVRVVGVRYRLLFFEGFTDDLIRPFPLAALGPQDLLL